MSSSLSEYSEEAVDLIVNAIDNLINFTETDYPINMNGYPFEWWLDNDFILNSGNFDMPSDNPLEVDESPNAKEVALFSIFPLEAAIHIDNSYDALSKAEALVLSGQLTGITDVKADAFRHAFWNALGSAAFSVHIMKLFADAHELGESGLAADMDFHNNDKGRAIGINYNAFTGNLIIVNHVLQDLYNGNLKYILNGNLVFTNQ
ncbi:hypothetical protein N7U66_18805 [Lacinutrix neustonica]|uniref:DUF6973 domain-containing protein n=1 Tax=Lacinutrix neustonica TaxID=2980107 RepID=A0A9E8MVV2_9FLAO|nr:hypothetical protein [Lacinutrix neustonica]WAC01884.1 hypothetical protein N7U66_18805 [Lacinutrix neustonica]